MFFVSFKAVLAINCNGISVEGAEEAFLF